MSIRYFWELARLHCACGERFSYPIHCKKDGFVTIQHNQIRKFTIPLMNKILNDVQIEPRFQSLSLEHFDANTANK